jgi:hypothetical protein
MNAREWLASEIREDLTARGEEPIEGEADWLDEVLGAALAEVGLSDRAIDLLMETANDSGQSMSAERHENVLATDPDLAQRRAALGISVEEAAAILGVPRGAYEAVEQYPARWQNVTPEAVAVYLARLGVAPARFVRWLATFLPAGQQFAWGYRPSQHADRPVEIGSSGEDRERLVGWGRALLAAAPLTQTDPDVQELFGHRWSAAALETRSNELADAVHRRILAQPMRTGAQIGPSIEHAVALPTSRGARFPAFQFDERGGLYRIVAEINALLDSDGDPWGVADWWLSPNPRLGVRPSALIAGGEEAQERLRRAARALVDEE